MELKVEREFQEKIPPLTEAEFDQLRENILNDGEVYEPIAVWNGIIVDGHNRWKIIKEHPEIPYRIKEMPFANKWEAFAWMYKKQLGRRNLSDEQKIYLMGKRNEAEKLAVGANQHTHGEVVQNGPARPKGKTAQRIADEYGVGYGTVIRAEEFAKGVDALRTVSPEAADKVLKGESKASKAMIREIPNLDKQKVEECAKSIISGEVQKVQEQTNKKRVTFPTEKRGKHKTPEAETDFELAISRDRDAVVEYTVADLLEEFRGINADFLRKYKTMFNFHNELINENAAEVQVVIDEVKIEIERMEAF